MKHTIYITFSSCWQLGSGYGDGYKSDSTMLRDEEGLLRLSGRTLKGALREGAARLSRCRDDLKKAEEIVFGTNSAEDKNNQSGLIRVSAGLLNAGLRQALLQNTGCEDILEDLLCRRKQTALDSEKQIKKGSLRTIECGIPGIQFEATVSIENSNIDEKWIYQYLKAVCAAVKSIGSNRSRGLGSCIITLKDDTAKAELPPVLDIKEN